MRLTNIAQATLPPGAVHSYALRPVGSRGRALPVSFDQGRHVGAGDRPGSWMSIALRLPPGTTRDALAAAWERAVANVSHLALYAGMFALPMSGVAMGYFGGKGLPFFWTTIPGAQGDAGEYGAPVDCWAVGCIVYELLCGAPPFQAKDEAVLYYKILENSPDFPKQSFERLAHGQANAAVELIRALTASDAAARLTAADALESAFEAAGGS